MEGNLGNLAQSIIGFQVIESGWMLLRVQAIQHEFSLSDSRILRLTP
jgi:hypothetical protein